MSSDSPADREAALALLREQHRFPGPYVFRIVVLPTAVGPVVSAVGAALGAGSEVASVDERQSRTGRYTALHLHTELSSAEEVLDVYEVVARLDGVLMSL